MIRKFLVVIINVAAIFGFIVLLGIMNAGKPQPERTEPTSLDPTVFVREAVYAPVQLSVSAQGEVRPKQDIALTTQVGGNIVSVSPDFAAGGVLRKGQELVQIEDADYRLAVTRARAQVAQMQTALEIERAESQLAQQDYDDLAAAGGLQNTPSDLTLRQPQLARAEADYNAAVANLRDAELALARTTVKAPFDGRVRSINANVGQFVSPGFTLGQVFSTDVAEIRLPLTDEDLARLGLSLAFDGEEEGPDVMLSAMAAGEMREWQGKIVRVDAAIDPSTRQVAAIVQVPDPYGLGADDGFPLAVGLFVDARIEGPMLDSAVTLPRTAINSDGSVYLVTGDDTVERRAVTVAAYTIDGAVITAGLDAGDRVIVSRTTVPEGSKVRPLDQDNPDAAEAEEPAEEDGAQAGAASARGDQGAAAGGSLR